MKELLDHVDELIASEDNLALERNAASVVDMHHQRAVPFSDWDVMDFADGLLLSGDSHSGQVIVDRPFSTVTSAFQISKSSLRRFAAGGLVVDYGSGQSDFLDTFGQSETLALDVRQTHLQRQKEHGHRIVRSSVLADEIVPPAGARLLNASWSEPFWSLSPESAKETARRFVRALEPSGIATIGPIANPDVHRDWEVSLQEAQTGAEPMGPWRDGDRAGHSMIFAAFIEELLKLSQQPTFTEGEARILWVRHPETNRRPIDVSAPNYAIIRKVQ